ncbi:MAG: intradiol ring-cleavage dioxygenase [Bacteroidetes bacterium]|nr:intradiol ring-cleavage dioxygenase [Bacteroidota bacterium]
MAKLLFSLLIFLLSTACNAQDNHQQDNRKNIKSGSLVGGPCEGCEAIHEYGDKQLLAVDTLPEFGKAGTPLKITGTIYQPDGITPAEGVILYIYHTNQEGIYPTRGEEKGWGRRHGYLRGWIKTGADGQYIFYTQQPGTYPSRDEPAHIHATIKEPHINEYYIDDYNFADDPLLRQTSCRQKSRGGAGVVELRKEGDLWVARRDIVLGLNIDNYR